MLEQALKFFIVFFVVVEPISLIPVFSGLTEGASDNYKHKMALKSVLVASGILLLFAVVGAGFLSAMGIAIDSFRIFGGCCFSSSRSRWCSRASPERAHLTTRKSRARSARTSRFSLLHSPSWLVLVR
jgi:small neutral amino acid transporter SnatA (MarC family)